MAYIISLKLTHTGEERASHRMLRKILPQEYGATVLCPLLVRMSYLLSVCVSEAAFPSGYMSTGQLMEILCQLTQQGPEIWGWNVVSSIPADVYKALQW